MLFATDKFTLSFGDTAKLTIQYENTTLTNTGKKQAIVEASNDGYTWAQVASIAPDSFLPLKIEALYVRLTTDTTISVVNTNPIPRDTKKSDIAVNINTETLVIKDDLQAYVSKQELKDLVHHPDLSGFVTKAQVQQMIPEIPTPPDITGLQAHLDSKLAKQEAETTYAKKTELPQPVDLSGYATKQSVDNLSQAVNALSGTGDVDLSALATKEELATKANTTHNHTVADINGLQTALDGKAPTSHSHSWNSITSKPTTFTPSTHTHGITDVTGLQDALDAKAPATHSHTVNWADISGKPTVFNPSTHTHTVSWNALTDKPASYPPAAHSHDWNSITGKPTTFVPSSHTHTWSQITGVPSSSTTAQGIVQLNDTLASTAVNQALSAAQGKALNDTKVNRAGDTMTGHLAVTYNSDWVGMAVKNPNNQKNGFYDVNIGGVTRGSFQIVHGGNNAYNAIINITSQGDNAERRIAGLTVSATGLHAHAYGHLHEYFVKTRDNQTIDGLKSFSSSITVGSHNNWGRVTFPLPDNTNWIIETNPQYKSLGVGQPAFRFNHNDGGNRIFYDLVKSNKSENIAYQSWTSDHFVAHDEVVNNLTSTDTNKPLSALQGKALNEQKFDKAGGVLTGTLYAANSGVKAASDNDTGIEWVRDGVMRVIADGRERIHIAHGGTSLRTQDGVSLTLQNDKNLVVYDEQNRPIFATNTVLTDIANKVNKAGDTMTGHLAVTYNSDWVGMAVKNPNNQKNGFYDVNIGGVTRGSFQIVHGGNNAYNAIINITSQGDNAERRIAGLTVSATGLHAHAYGHLHEYFVKTRDNQTIDGNKTFSQEVVTTQANGFRIKNSAKNRSIFWRFDGDILYLLKTPNGDPNGNWDDARPLEWNVNTNQLVVRGNADTATRLQTARNIALTGAVTGNVNFDGSGNVSLATTLTKATVRDFNRTISGTATALGSTTNTIEMTGQVVVSADGLIRQYFHLKHFRDWWFGRDDNAVGYQNHDIANYKIPIALWTAMPNKVLSVQAQTMRSSDIASSAQFSSEAAEHEVAWAFRNQGINKSNVWLNLSRTHGGASEHIDLFVIVEGY